MEEIIRIKTFGGFSMSYCGRTITDQDNRSKKLWLILEYLIAFHDRHIPQGNIIDMIWNENSITTDPENALKTSLHRIRGLLDDLEIPEKKLILRKQGTISWNNDIKCVFDFEEFMSHYNKAMAENLSKEERIEHSRAALDLYKGDFLPKCQTETWSAALATRYHSLYIKLLLNYVTILQNDGMFTEMADYCSVANAIDALNEDVNYYLIYALYKMGDKQRAIEQYNRIVNVYYNEFGIDAPRRLFELYEEITVHEECVEADLNSIQADLVEKNAQRIAYLCDYSVFQHFYKLHARACARNGVSIYIMLITIKQRSKEEPDSAKIAAGVEKMERVISTSLRSSDIFARYSRNQYIIMLPAACYENSLAVGERILTKFDREKPKLSLNVSYSVRYLEPMLFEQNGDAFEKGDNAGH